MKKAIAAFLAVFMLLTLLAGCQPAEQGGAEESESGTIKFGFLGPLTGAVAQYGIAVRDGVKMYIDEVNESGGLLGKQIELVEVDEKGDVTEAINGYNKLVDQDKVDVIFGSVTSQPTLAVAELSAEADDPIPMITASATHQDVTSFGDNMFRTCFLDPFQSEKMALYAAQVLEAKTAAVIYNNSTDYSTGLYNVFKETIIAEGVSVVAEESYSDGAVDFKSQLTVIAAADPDVLFIPDYYGQVALIANQARALGITATFLGCDGWDGVLASTETPEDFDDAFFSNHYAADDPDEAIQGFRSKFTAIYGTDPMSFAATGYDAAMVIVDAIKRAGTTDHKAVIQALKETNLDCVTSTITFDDDNNPIKSCAVIKFVKDASGAYSYAFEQRF